VNGTALTLGTIVSSTIAVGGEVDTYVFSLASDGQLLFDSLQNTTSVTWSLSGPAGAVVTNQTLANADGPNVANPALSVPAGSYVLTVRGLNATSTGAYSFRLSNLLDPAASTLITPTAVGTPATVTSGTLSPGNETDVFRFVATPNSQFFFDSRSVTGGGANWRLIDAFGNVVFQSTNAATDVDTLTLSAGGTYFLLIEGVVGNAGAVSYSFALQPVRA